MLTIDKAKEQVQILKKFLASGDNLISHSACLEVIALINGYHGWNHLCTTLNTTKKDNKNV